MSKTYLMTKYRIFNTLWLCCSSGVIITDRCTLLQLFYSAQIKGVTSFNNAAVYSHHKADLCIYSCFYWQDTTLIKRMKLPTAARTQPLHCVHIPDLFYFECKQTLTFAKVDTKYSNFLTACTLYALNKCSKCDFAAFDGSLCNVGKTLEMSNRLVKVSREFSPFIKFEKAAATTKSGDKMWLKNKLLSTDRRCWKEGGSALNVISSCTFHCFYTHGLKSLMRQPFTTLDQSNYSPG